MKHLSGLDSTFLYLETPETPMHVGGLNLFEMPAGHTGDFYEDVKAHVASRMHLAPVFTRKLALMPFELASPVCIEDDAIDLDYHVRRIILPKPGSMAQLETYVGRLHSSLMDRSRLAAATSPLARKPRATKKSVPPALSGKRKPAAKEAAAATPRRRKAAPTRTRRAAKQLAA